MVRPMMIVNRPIPYKAEECCYVRTGLKHNWVLTSDQLNLEKMFA